jgi:hypothetical protein
MPLMLAAELITELRTLSPSCGPVRVIAVDGPSGAGKSTFAARLGAALPAQVIGSDQFPHPWDAEPLAWWPPLAEQILHPLSTGRTARFRPYDWHHDTYGPSITVPPADFLIIEGVGAAARQSPAAYRIWVDAPAHLRRRRVIQRDGAEYAAAWDAWTLREQAHFAADGTPGRCNLHVYGDGTAGDDRFRAVSFLNTPTNNREYPGSH